MAEDNRYRIPKPSFKSTTEDLLYAMLMGGICRGREDLEVDDSTVIQLTPPDGASYALIQVEADSSSSDVNKAIVFRQDAGTPDGSSSPKVGQVQGDGGVFDVKGTNNMSAFRVIGIEAGKTHVLHIEYFG